MASLAGDPAALPQRRQLRNSWTPCARSACAGSARPCRSTTRPRRAACCTPSATWSRSRSADEPRRRGARAARRADRDCTTSLPFPGAAARASASAAARGRATARPPGAARRAPAPVRAAKEPGALRGRPDADPHADAQAARPAHEEVDAVRALPHPHPAGQPGRRWRPASRPAPRSPSRLLREPRLGDPQGDPREDPRPSGELAKALNRAGATPSAPAPAQADRGRRRQLRRVVEK